MKKIDVKEYAWHRRFAWLPHLMGGFGVAWFCWIEVRVNYYRPYEEERRWVERAPVRASHMIAVAVLSTMMAVPALAAEPEPLTVAKCLQVYNALSTLDSYSKVVGEKPVTLPYRFGGPLRFAIAQTLTTLRPFADSTEKARVAMLQEIGQGRPIEANSPELAKLNTEYLKIIEAPCGVRFAKIGLSDLKLGDEEGQNPIPPSILSLLMPIIDPDK